MLKRIKADPDNPELHQKLGNLYFKQGAMGKSKAAYRRALQLNPEDPWTHLFIGNWHYTAGEYREAKERDRKDPLPAPHGKVGAGDACPPGL